MLTLHKLPESFIVTSDKKIKVGDLYIVNLQHITGPYDGHFTLGIDCKKVIAQQDQIDFSALTEEEQKEIGWFDWISNWEIINNRLQNVGGVNPYAYQKGFQKAQELLSDRRFTLEEVGELFQQVVRIIPEQELRKWTKESFVKHLAAPQNRSWTIEVETEEYVQEETGTELKWVGRRPKFTNGKIKILKIK